MRFDISKYVNMEATVFKGKSKDEIYVLLSEGERMRCFGEYFLDRLEEILSGAKNIVGSDD